MCVGSFQKFNLSGGISGTFISPLGEQKKTHVTNLKIPDMLSLQVDTHNVCARRSLHKNEEHIYKISKICLYIYVDQFETTVQDCHYQELKGLVIIV